MIFGLTIAIFVGIFVGTYSSIYISSPILVWLRVTTASFLPRDPVSRAARRPAQRKMTAPRFERAWTGPPRAGRSSRALPAAASRSTARSYEGVLLTPGAAAAWDAPALADLAEGHVAPLLALEPPPEFLLLGTGARHGLPAARLRRRAGGAGIGVEAMDSRAAARTWGLLRGEGRWIAAALMPL